LNKQFDEKVTCAKLRPAIGDLATATDSCRHCGAEKLLYADSGLLSLTRTCPWANFIAFLLETVYRAAQPVPLKSNAKSERHSVPQFFHQAEKPSLS
jgi:hypothetical protein